MPEQARWHIFIDEDTFVGRTSSPPLAPHSTIEKSRHFLAFHIKIAQGLYIYHLSEQFTPETAVGEQPTRSIWQKYIFSITLINYITRSALVTTSTNKKS